MHIGNLETAKKVAADLKTVNKLLDKLDADKGKIITISADLYTPIVLHGHLAVEARAIARRQLEADKAAIIRLANRIGLIL